MYAAPDPTRSVVLSEPMSAQLASALIDVVLEVSMKPLSDVYDGYTVSFGLLRIN